MNESEAAEPARFSQEDLEWILERAIALDALRENEVSEAEVRDMGNALGLDPNVVVRAMSELRTARAIVRPSQVRPSHGAPVEVLGLATLGGIAVLLVETLGAFGGFSIVGALVTLSVALGLDSRRPDAIRRYWIRIAGLWGGCFVIATVTTGGAGLIGLAAIPLLLGSGVLLLGRWIAQQESGPRPPAPPMTGNPRESFSRAVRLLWDRAEKWWSERMDYVGLRTT